MTTATLDVVPPHLQSTRRPSRYADAPGHMSRKPSGLDERCSSTILRLSQGSNLAGTSASQISSQASQPCTSSLDNSRPNQPDKPNKDTVLQSSSRAACPGSSTRPHDIRQDAAPGLPAREAASLHCPATPPPSPVSSTMIISRASWPRDISPLDLTQASTSAQKPPRGSPVAGRTASGRIMDSATSGLPSGLLRYSIPEALPVQVPRAHSNSALTAMLPPILKAYPSQSSLQHMLSTSSGDMTGPLASSSMQDTTPRGTMIGPSLASSGPQHGSGSLETPHAQGMRSAPPSPHAAVHSPSSLTGDGSLHRQNSRVHGGVPAFAQHLDELSSEEMEERCYVLFDLPISLSEPRRAGPANGQANGHPEGGIRHPTNASAQPTSPFMEYEESQARPARGEWVPNQAGASTHSRNLSCSTLDGSLGDGSRDNSVKGNSSYHGNPSSGASLTPPPSPLTGFQNRGSLPTSRRSFPGLERASSAFIECPRLSNRSSGSDTNLKQRGSSAALLALQSSSSGNSGPGLLSLPSDQRAASDEARMPMQVHDAEP